MTGVLQLVVAWLAVSVAVMAALTAYVYLSSGRRRGAPAAEFVTFDDDRARAGVGAARVGTPDVIDLRDLDERHEPAITHQVSTASGALDRLLAGASMPCGLERLHPDGEDERVRMAFFTRSQEPKVVAVSVADELRRLGIDVEPLSFTEARAWRDGLELVVTLHLEPQRFVRGRRLAFPNAPRDSLVVEFSVV
jgi:hypothetical protein